MGSFDYFDHEADVGIHVRGRSLPDLFGTAGRALMEWMGPVPGRHASVSESIHLEADNLEDLLVRWLQEILYLSQVRRVYWMEMKEMKVSDRQLDAEISGIPFDSRSIREFQEIKAITYHQLQVSSLEDGWQAKVIIDI